jgi:hypothetical protein
MNTIVVAEIEKTTRLALTATPYFSPIWKYDLWLLAYVKTLPFMADDDTEYPATPYAFSNLIVDYVPYYGATSLAECISTAESYFVSGSTLYVHGTDGRPIWKFLSVQYGRLYGFTNKGVRRYNQVTYLPLVESVPNVSDAVDPVEYSKMAFKSGSLTLINDLATFDEMASVFGNDMNVKAGPDGEYSDLIPIAKYYIDTYVSGTSRTRFSLKDKRELLSAKAPNTFFNATDYPYIEENKVDRVIPDAFGELVGVPGTCINGTQTASAKTFKFAPVITRLDHVYVLKDEKWSEVSAASTDLPNGTVTLSTANAHVGGDTAKGIVKVKIDGLFRPEVNPGDVIAKINEAYGNIQYLAGNYDIVEWEAELGPLADIGLYLDESKDVSEWIERVQNGSTVGFQYLIEYDRITARLDNPNRAVAFNIRPVDIMDVSAVQVDYNANIYASSALVRYGADQESGDAKQVINDEFEEEVLDVHRKEKQYECDSLMPDLSGVTAKAAVIMDDQKDIRPVFRGVALWGAEWLAVRLYDIVTATISIPGVTPRVPYPYDTRLIDSGSADWLEVVSGRADAELITLMGPAPTEVAGTSRTFVGLVRCQVVGINRDVAGCIVSLDLRQRDYSAVVASVLGG